MKTKEAFPRICAWLDQAAPEWSLAFGGPDLDWMLDASTNRLRDSLIFTQQMWGSDLDRLAELTTEILLDILALRQTATAEEVFVLNLLQLDIAVTVMGTAYVQKRLQLIFDWAIYSISDDYPYPMENQFETSRIADLFNHKSPSVYAAVGRHIGLDWIRFFYYYVFKVGGHKELARLLARPAIELLGQLLPASDAIEPAVRVAEWSVRDNYAGRGIFVSKLKQVFDGAVSGTQTHLVLGISFALLIGKDSGVDTKALALELLQSYRGALPPSWRLQLLQAALIPGPIDIGRHLNAITESIQSYREETLSVAPRPVIVEYEFERSFTLISPIVVSLLKAGQSNAATAVIAAWNGLSAVSGLQDVLFFVPNEANGALYSRQGKVYVVDNPASDSFVELIGAINHFHGTNIVLDDDDSLPPHIPTRPGLPEDPVKSSNDYLAAMRRQFRLLQARDFLEEAKRSNVGALRLLPGLPCPLQPLMISDIGFSWPIASSMSSPNLDRKCRRVLIWTEGILIGEQQSRWIAEVLRPQMQITFARGDVERFRTEFSNPDYDIIWITAHGEFDHVDPHRSMLAICEGTEMRFDDLEGIQIPEKERRLLILDVCDSGAVPVYGGLSDLSFGPMLASASQAVVSYRWPVEQFPSALFNVLLAIGLRSKSFYTAYEFAIATLLQGKDRTIEELTDALGLDHELIGRLRDNESIRWKTLAFWGSAAFME